MEENGLGLRNEGPLAVCIRNIKQEIVQDPADILFQ